MQKISFAFSLLALWAMVKDVELHHGVFACASFVSGTFAMSFAWIFRTDRRFQGYMESGEMLMKIIGLSLLSFVALLIQLLVNKILQ